MSGEIVHLALGGTISMRIVEGLAVPAMSAAELAEIAGIKTTPVDLATVGGPQLNFALLTRAAAAIHSAQARGVSGVIVTLGTDAIEEVGAFLAYTGPWKCNVVVTGAMIPAAEPGSDGPGNLRDAAAVAAGAQLPEPVVVFAGRVALARAVVKVSGLDQDAFASPTDRSWELAQVISGGELPGAGTTPLLLGEPGDEAPDVPIIVSALSVGVEQDLDPWDPGAAGGVGAPGTAGAAGAAGAAAQRRGRLYPPAIVCVASGAGNLTPAATLSAEHALAAGSVVGIATRALDRRLSAGYGYPGGSGTLSAAGAVLATGMSAHRLRIFLLIALSQGLRGDALKQTLSAHVESLAR